MNTKALLEAVEKDPRNGMLLIAERLGALLVMDEDLHTLLLGLTGHVPEDERSKGIRDALLELLSCSEAARVKNLWEEAVRVRDLREALESGKSEEEGA